MPPKSTSKHSTKETRLSSSISTENNTHIQQGDNSEHTTANLSSPSNAASNAGKTDDKIPQSYDKIPESIKQQSMDCVDRIACCSDESLDNYEPLKLFRHYLAENPGTPISGLSSSYIAKNIDILTVAKFGNGGIQNAITNKKGLNVPTSIIQIGIVCKPFYQLGQPKSYIKAGQHGKKSMFDTYSLQVQLWKEKVDLTEILSHLCHVAGMDYIGWNQYDVKDGAFNMGRIYWDENNGDMGFKAVKNCEEKKYIKVYDCTTVTTLTIDSIMKSPEIIPRVSPTLGVGDKIIIGTSIALAGPDRGWKLMPNWIALVERSATGEIGSPAKKARVDETLEWPDSE